MITVIQIRTHLLVSTLVRRLATFLDALLPRLEASVIDPFDPGLMGNERVMEEINGLPAPVVKHGNSRLVFGVSRQDYTIRSHLLRTTVRGVLHFLRVISTYVVSPSIKYGSRQDCRVRFAVQYNSLHVSHSVDLTAPYRVTLVESFLVLRMSFTPSPRTIRSILLIGLCNDRRSVQRTLNSRVAILCVTSVSRKVTRLRVGLILAMRRVVRRFIRLLIGVDLLVTRFNGRVAVLIDFGDSLFPERHVGTRPIGLGVNSALRKCVRDVGTLEDVRRLDASVLPNYQLQGLRLDSSVTLLTVNSSCRRATLGQLNAGNSFFRLLIARVRLVVCGNDVQFTRTYLPSNGAVIFVRVVGAGALTLRHEVAIGLGTQAYLHRSRAS